MFDTCSCSSLDFLFPVSFLLSPQCWCQEHVQHLPLYFFHSLNTLKHDTPSYFQDRATLHISSPSTSFPSLIFVSCSEDHIMSPNPFMSLSLHIYLHFSMCPSNLPGFWRLYFSRMFPRCSLNQFTRLVKERMLPREVRGLVKIA